MKVGCSFGILASLALPISASLAVVPAPPVIGQAAPQKVAPREVAPQKVAPREVAPREVAPQKVAPREAVPLLIELDGLQAAKPAVGEAPHAYLGLLIAETANGVGGAEVEDVLPGGPAAAAGVRAGDLVVSLAGRAIQTPAQLVNSVRELPIGRKVTLKIVRNHLPLLLKTTLIKRPALEPTPQPVDGLIEGDGFGNAIAMPGEVGGRGSRLPNRVGSAQDPVSRGSLFVSGRVRAVSVDAPVADAVVAAYQAPQATDDGMVAVTNTLGNGSYVLRLPGPGHYRLTFTAGRAELDEPINVSARGATRVEARLPVRLRGTVRPSGYLGVVLGPAPIQTAKPGVSVEDVIAGAPADAAGVRPEDLILAVNGKPERSAADLSSFIGAAGPGKQVSLRISRYGRILDLPVRLGATIPSVEDGEQIWPPDLTDYSATAPNPQPVPLLDGLEREQVEPRLGVVGQPLRR